MPTKKKYKPMTNREKKLKREVRSELRGEGLLPPPKRRLNRKKFIMDTKNAWNEKPACYIWDHFLLKATFYMLGHFEKTAGCNASLEAVGAAKTMAIALKLKEFHDRLEERGEKQYSLMEEHDYIKYIFDL